jgi:hypothetical protein
MIKKKPHSTRLIWELDSLYSKKISESFILEVLPFLDGIWVEHDETLLKRLLRLRSRNQSELNWSHLPFCFRLPGFELDLCFQKKSLEEAVFLKKGSIFQAEVYLVSSHRKKPQFELEVVLLVFGDGFPPGLVEGSKFILSHDLATVEIVSLSYSGQKVLIDFKCLDDVYCQTFARLKLTPLKQASPIDVIGAPHFLNTLLDCDVFVLPVGTSLKTILSFRSFLMSKNFSGGLWLECDLSEGPLDEIFSTIDGVVLNRQAYCQPVFDLPRLETEFVERVNAHQKPIWIRSSFMKSYHLSAIPSRAELSDLVISSNYSFVSGLILQGPVSDVFFEKSIFSICRETLEEYALENSNTTKTSVTRFSILDSLFEHPEVGVVVMTTDKKWSFSTLAQWRTRIPKHLLMIIESQDEQIFRLAHLFYLTYCVADISKLTDSLNLFWINGKKALFIESKDDEIFHLKIEELLSPLETV